MGRVGKSKHTAIACTSCRRRKIRCDSQRPKCENCISSTENCEYREIPRQSIPATSLSAVYQRLNALEEKVSLLSEPAKYSLAEPRSMGKPISSWMETEKKPAFMAEEPNEKKSKELLIPFRDMPTSNPTFNDRLADFKAQVNGEKEYSNMMYTSGLFFIILGPTEIEKISIRLYDSHLMEYLEYVSYTIWLKTQSLHAQLVHPLWQSLPQGSFLDQCKEVCAEKFAFYPLITLKDIEKGVFSEIPGQQEQCQNAMNAAIIIVGCIKMRENKEFEMFPKSFLDTQETLAYYHAIKILSLIKFSPPSFCLLRISAFLWRLLYDNTATPSLQLLLRSILDMARAVGLNELGRSPHSGSPQPPDIKQRIQTSCVLVSFQHSISISLSLKPYDWKLDTQALLNGLTCPGEVEIYKHVFKLHQVYSKTHHLLFSLPIRRAPIQEIHHLVVELGRELAEWEENGPEGIWNHDNSSSEIKSTYFCPQYEVHCEYYHTLIAIHSVSAFNPECFPDQSQMSLNKVTQAARQLLNVCLGAQKMKSGLTLLESSAVTAALCVFLYKQICFPGEQSLFADMGYIRDFMSKFSDLSLWPGEDSEIPTVEIWRTLVQIMNRVSNAEQERARFSGI